MKPGDLVRFRIDYILPEDWDGLAHKAGAIVDEIPQPEGQYGLFRVLIGSRLHAAFEYELEAL